MVIVGQSSALVIQQCVSERHGWTLVCSARLTTVHDTCHSELRVSGKKSNIWYLKKG